MTTPHNRGLVRVASPASEPLLLNETKEYLRITHDEDDAYISELIVSARILAEQHLKISLITQTWRISFDDNVGEALTLPMAPVQSVTSVVTTQLDGSTQTVNAALYRLNAAKNGLIFTDTPRGVKTEITYVAGFGNSTTIPKPVKHGLLAHVSAMYDGEVGIAAIPDIAQQLYAPFREIRL